MTIAVRARTVEPEFLPMRACDIDAIAALEHEIYAHPWTRGNFSDSLDAGYSAWVMRANGVLAGYALMTLVLDEAQLLNISIAPHWQRQRLGTALLAHLLHIARSHGAATIYLEVRRSNGAALGFYRHHGFLPIGERRGYYPARDGREDALVLAKDLHAGNGP